MLYMSSNVDVVKRYGLSLWAETYVAKPAISSQSRSCSVEASSSAREDEGSSSYSLLS